MSTGTAFLSNFTTYKTEHNITLYNVNISKALQCTLCSSILYPNYRHSCEAMYIFLYFWTEAAAVFVRYRHFYMIVSIFHLIIKHTVNIQNYCISNGKKDNVLKGLFFVFSRTWAFMEHDEKTTEINTNVRMFKWLEYLCLTAMC